MKRNKFMDFINDNQSVALGFTFGNLIAVLVLEGFRISFFISLILITLLIANRFYQILIKYDRRLQNETKTRKPNKK